MRITLISPYHGGSHAAWAKGYRDHSEHVISLLTLPARFWKWRMHGGAVTLARRYGERGERPDLIVATDMLDLATFLALARPGVPTVLYMHENQLTYPLPHAGQTGAMRRQKGERDLHYAFINYTSLLAADQVFFNSAFHRESLLGELPRFLKHFPEFNELPTVEQIAAKSAVLPVGIELPPERHRPVVRRETPPLILWNQRWEYDKNPRAFFQALYRLQAEGLPFRLALCGENFRQRPQEFEEGLQRLADRIIHSGFAAAERYRELLWEADIVVSTARHEFFGISILEAIAAQTYPILPARLSYPELLPDAYHLSCLYQSEAGLLQRMRWALAHPAEAYGIARDLAGAVQRYRWEIVAPAYDKAFAVLLSG